MTVVHTGPRTFQARVEDVIRVQWNWSATSREQAPTFASILKRFPGHVIEIGTHQGVSAAFMADLGHTVSTVDVIPNPARAKVWRALEVESKIDGGTFKRRAHLDAFVRGAAARATLAFVDGGHLAPDVAYDFALVQYVPAIVLHDYWSAEEDWPDVRGFVDALPARDWKVEILHPFAVVTHR